MLKKLITSILVAHAQLLLSPVGMIVVAMDGIFTAILFPNFKKMPQPYHALGLIFAISFLLFFYGLSFYIYSLEKKKEKK